MYGCTGEIEVRKCVLKIDKIELHLLLEAIRMKYGYDFSGYTEDTLRRRVLANVSKAGLSSVSEMIPKVLGDPLFFERLVYDMSITVTEMFRDPPVYLALREKVIPVLKTYPYINIWHAGCATGQEVYSMAILLKEEGLYERSQIYATDINDDALAKGREGIYPAEEMNVYTRNYQLSGGKKSFADYYHAKYDNAMIDKSLKKNVTFANHNLVTDGVFAEIHLLLCRNVFIYFNKQLQNQVLGLFRESLCRGGFLCMGSSESVNFSDVACDFVDICAKEKIYQKKSSIMVTAL